MRTTPESPAMTRWRELIATADTIETLSALYESFVESSSDLPLREWALIDRLFERTLTDRKIFS